MAYLEESDLAAHIPPNFLTEALDDDNDGEADAGLLDLIIEEASLAVDAYLAGRYETPFTDPVPAIAGRAARVFTLESLYLRRGYNGEENPWTSEADKLRERLEKIGEGDAPLEAGTTKKTGSVVFVTEKAKSSSSSRKNSV